VSFGRIFFTTLKVMLAIALIYVLFWIGAAAIFVALVTS